MEVAPGGVGETADPAARQKAVDEYLSYVKGQAAELVTLVGSFADAVKAGDLSTAKVLFAGGTLHGQGPLVDRLVTDVAELQDAIGSIELEPAQIANGPVGLLDEISVSKITGEEDMAPRTSRPVPPPSSGRSG